MMRVFRNSIAGVLIPMVIIACFGCSGEKTSKMGKSQSDHNYKFDSGEAAFRIPFELYGNLIFVEVMVNDSGPLWFILDSGCEYSLLSKETAGKSGLKMSGPEMIEQPGGEIEVYSTGEVSFGMPGVRFINQTVPIYPLESLESIAGRSINGILGHDVFERFVVVINYDSQYIDIYEPDGYEYQGDGEILEVTVENDEAFIETEIEHPAGRRIQARLMLDTGSINVIGFNGSYVKATELFGSNQKTIPALGIAIGGKTENYVTRIEALHLGKIDIINPVVGASVDTLRSGDAGTIAGEVFRRFTLIFDYAHGRLILEKNRHFDELYEYDMSGIFPIGEFPDFAVKKVLAVMPGTPAAESGILAGDYIEEIDGLQAGQLSILEIRRIFIGDGKTVRLKIRRDQDILEKNIKLKRLI
nr:aspartyl protease family protein [candidate division Zixibacteria bacterium]